MEEQQAPREENKEISFLQRRRKDVAVIMGVISAVFFCGSLMLLPPQLVISITASGQPAYIGYGPMYLSLLMVCQMYAAIKIWRTGGAIWVRINIVLFALNIFTFWLNY